MAKLFDTFSAGNVVSVVHYSYQNHVTKMYVTKMYVTKYVTKMSYCVEYNGSGFQQKVCAIGYISNRKRLGLSTVDFGVLTLGYFVPCIPSF